MSRISYPVAQVLKMDTRIAQKGTIGCVSEYPSDADIRQGPALQLFLVSLDIGKQGSIYGENASRRSIVYPEKLGVFETLKVEAGYSIPIAWPQVAPIQDLV